MSEPIASAEPNTASVWRTLRIFFGIVPIVAGLDKFTNLLVVWEKYLAPQFAHLVPAHAFMLAVGIIEIVAGIGVLFTPWTKVFATIVGLWLLGIARHVSLNRPRTASDKDLDQVVDPKRRSARSMAIRREMDRLLERALERMTPNDRQIVDLHYRAGLSRKDIAERLDLPIEAVHARCDRAHSRLRGALSRHFTTVALSRLEPEGVSLDDIRALRPAFRQVITARHLQGLGDREAAQQLQLPEATFRARLASAYEILRCEATADFTKAREQYLAEKD